MLLEKIYEDYANEIKTIRQSETKTALCTSENVADMLDCVLQRTDAEYKIYDGMDDAVKSVTMEKRLYMYNKTCIAPLPENLDDEEVKTTLLHETNIIITHFNINDLIKLTKRLAEDERWGAAWAEEIENEEEMTDEDIAKM